MMLPQSEVKRIADLLHRQVSVQHAEMATRALQIMPREQVAAQWRIAADIIEGTVPQFGLHAS